MQKETYKVGDNRGGHPNKKHHNKIHTNIYYSSIPTSRQRTNFEMFFFKENCLLKLLDISTKLSLFSI